MSVIPMGIGQRARAERKTKDEGSDIPEFHDFSFQGKRASEQSEAMTVL
jgi:hypothetical protein